MLRTTVLIMVFFLFSCNIFQSSDSNPEDSTTKHAPLVFASPGDSILSMHPGKSVISGVLKLDTLSEQSRGKVPVLNGSENYLLMDNADLLIYDAVNPSETAKYLTQSDDEGQFYAIVNPGRYFAFAFKFDPMSIGLIKAKAPEFDAIADKITVMGVLKQQGK